MQIIRVPSLAENVNEATVAEWLVREGEAVKAGQGIAELITEKASFTFEVDEGGTVSAIIIPEKSVMPVGGILCLLDATADEIAAARTENDQRIAQHFAAPEIAAPTLEQATAPPPRTGGIVRATPVARRLAKEHNLDLTEIVAKYDITGAVKEAHVRDFLAG